MDKYYDYLNGTKYTNCLNYTFKSNNYLNRIEFIIGRCKNKTVLHFGFVDHNFDTINSKINSDTWLHKKIMDVSNKVYGIDIIQKEIVKLRKKGYSNLYCVNILKDKIPTKLKKIYFDEIVLGKILEHINNPVRFLSIIKKNFKFKEIIITVPNAFYIGNFLNCFRNTECVNSDHRYWFTPYTISKNVYLSGLSVKKMFFSYNRLNKYNLILRFIKFKFPFLNSTIVLLVK